MADDVVTRFRLQAGTGGKDVITHFRARTTGAGRKDVITRFRMQLAATNFSVEFAPPLPTNFNPFDFIALTVAPSLAADTVTVTQTAGPSTLVIAGTGVDRSTTAPARLTTGTYTVRVSATKAGYATATSDYTFTVAAHGGFYRKTGTGVRITSP